MEEVLVVRKNRWGKLALVSLLVILIIELLQGITRLFAIPSGYIGGGMHSGMNATGSTPFNEFFNFMFSLMIILLICVLFFGIIGLLFSVSVSNELANIKQTNSNKTSREREFPSVYVPQVMEIMVSAHNMTFEPKIIKVKKGMSVKLTFKNEEEVVNNFVIEGLNVETDILEPHAEQTIEFIAETQGDYITRSTVSNIQSRSGMFIVQ